MRSSCCAFNNAWSSINLSSDSDMAGSSSLPSPDSVLSVGSVEKFWTAMDRGVNINVPRRVPLGVASTKLCPDAAEDGSQRVGAEKVELKPPWVKQLKNKVCKVGRQQVWTRLGKSVSMPAQSTLAQSAWFGLGYIQRHCFFPGEGCGGK